MFQKSVIFSLFLVIITTTLSTLCSATWFNPPYTMTLREEYICIVHDKSDALIFRSNVSSFMLSPADELLLALGISLDTQQEFTRALEDFCS